MTQFPETRATLLADVQSPESRHAESNSISKPTSVASVVCSTLPASLTYTQHANAQLRNFMKVFIGSSLILVAMLAAFVGQRIYSVNVKQAERDVRFPLSELDSYVASIRQAN